MVAQRVRGAESRMEPRISNGPLRAQSKDLRIRVLCDVWAYVSCRRYVSILQSAWECTRESRWHRGKDLDLPSLTE